MVGFVAQLASAIPPSTRAATAISAKVRCGRLNCFTAADSRPNRDFTCAGIRPASS